MSEDEARRLAGPHCSAMLLPLDATDLGVRLAAVSEYVTRRDVVWNEGESLAAAIVRHAGALAGSERTPAERQWRRG